MMGQMTSGSIPLDIAGWLGCFVFVIAGMNQVFRFLAHFREQPPPSQTYQPKGDYATRTELNVLRQEITGRLVVLDSDIKEVLSAGEDRARSIHKRLDDQPNQIVALLRNTGAIGGRSA